MTDSPWKMIDISYQTQDGRYGVKAVRVFASETPGLSLCFMAFDNSWSVIHDRTGGAIAGYRCPEYAAMVAAKLGEVPIPWHESGETLAAYQHLVWPVLDNWQGDASLGQGMPEERLRR